MATMLDISVIAEGRAFEPRRVLDEPLGGMQTATIGLCSALAALGHRVRVFAPVAEAHSYRSVAYLPVERLLSDVGEPDVLIGIRRLLPFLLPVPARARVLWLHDAPTHPLNRGAVFFDIAPPGGEAQSVGMYPLSTVAGAVDRFFAISAWQAEEYCRFHGIPPERFFVTANGVDLHLIDGATGERDPRRLLYASAPDKGLDVLLRVWPVIREQVPGATLRVCSSFAGYGWSSELPALAGIDAPGVKATGFVSPRELAVEMRRAAILAYPNHAPECHSITVTQAAAAGMAIVTSAYAGLAERTEHGADGILIPGSSKRPGYEAAFVASVVRLLTRPDEAQRLGDAARSRAIREWSWDSIARAWTEEMDRLCAGKPRRSPDLAAMNLAGERARTLTVQVGTTIPLDAIERALAAEARRYGFEAPALAVGA